VTLKLGDRLMATNSVYPILHSDTPPRRDRSMYLVGECRNAASCRDVRIPQRGRFRKAPVLKGQYYDGMGYRMLCEEWLTCYPQGFVASLV
jgi:hypothetical protein